MDSLIVSCKLDIYSWNYSKKYIQLQIAIGIPSLLSSEWDKYPSKRTTDSYKFFEFSHYVSCWISAFFSELKAVWGAPRLLPKKNPYLWLLNAVLKIRNILLEAISRLDLSLWSWYLTFYLSPVISYLLSLSQQQ